MSEQAANLPDGTPSPRDGEIFPPPPPPPPRPTPLARPHELDLLTLEQSAVIEASAGTGKTYLLEHLLLELLLTGRARLDQILVVTFTERATAELVTRIRQKIDQALALPLGTTIGRWRFDAGARARLAEARQSFDQAAISTIHGFCQGVLTDEPLATRQLLAQTQVDERQAFAEAFRDVLRDTLAHGGDHPPYLDAYLSGAGRSVETLERLLFNAASTRGTWAVPFDETALRALAEKLARLDPEDPPMNVALTEKGPHKIHHSTVGAMLRRLRRLVPTAQQAHRTGDCARLLAHLDEEAELFSNLEKVAALPTVRPALMPLHEIAVMAATAAPPLDEVIAMRFLPLVAARLRARKLTEGLYDFDDMIRSVDEALEGDLGPMLIGKLRQRFKVALVDEAQDTEPAQWRIFRRVFLESDQGHSIFLIGDPKQAIYGFRGADVQTYVEAREDIRARGGAVLPLARNFRSRPEVVGAYNAILDDDAWPRYFSGKSIRYQHPVTAAREALGPGAGVTLLSATFAAENDKPPRIGVVRRALREAITDELGRLLARPDPPRASKIFVLVRTNVEAREMAVQLHSAGIANILFKPDDIFRSAEATHLRALLLAIADPSDRAARLAAWLTPFFDVTLADIGRIVGMGEPPPEHPLMARLVGWKSLGDARAYDALWARILEDSGVARRLRLSAADLRRLANYRQLLDILHEQSSARPLSVLELAALLGAFAAGRRRGANDKDTQQMETEAEAVRIMTIHAAKGLEADYVFLYGAFTARVIWRNELSVYSHDTQRLRCAGRPRVAAVEDQIKATRDEEDQRLMYVALTRAREHLYLPFFPAVDVGDIESSEDHGDCDLFKKITGPYRHINQRLRALMTDQAHAGLFQARPIAVVPPATRSKEMVAEAVERWTLPMSTAPSSFPNLAIGSAARLDLGLRARRRGFAITSFSRLSDAAGGYRHAEAPLAAASDGADSLAITDPRAAALVDPVERLEAPAVGSGVGGDLPATPLADTLPGGIASGLFLHGVLEKVDLGALPDLPEWRERPEVRHLFDAELRRWDRDPRFLRESARLVHAALTVPITMPDGTTLPGITRAPRVRREVDFMFPLPSAASVDSAAPLASAEDRLVHERGFVRGALDVLFEHRGRVCFADWKSNLLPAYSPTAVRAHVELNYDLQVQIYTLALVRMLGIRDSEDYEQRFGGLVYLFLRGLGDPAGAPGDGLFVHRPSYAEVQHWSEELGRRRIAGAGEPS